MPFFVISRPALSFCRRKAGIYLFVIPTNINENLGSQISVSVNPNSSKDTLFGVFPKYYLDYFHNSELIHNFGIITNL